MFSRQTVMNWLKQNRFAKWETYCEKVKIARISQSSATSQPEPDPQGVRTLKLRQLSRYERNQDDIEKCPNVCPGMNSIPWSWGSLISTLAFYTQFTISIERTHDKLKTCFTNRRMQKTRIRGIPKSLISSKHQARPLYSDMPVSPM
jgi:hypothetical protein